MVALGAKTNSGAHTDPRRTNQNQPSARPLEADRRKDGPPNAAAHSSSAKDRTDDPLDDPTTCHAPLFSKVVKPTAPTDFVNTLLNLQRASR
jgi:hypothetical protein